MMHRLLSLNSSKRLFPVVAVIILIGATVSYPFLVGLLSTNIKSVAALSSTPLTRSIEIRAVEDNAWMMGSYYDATSILTTVKNFRNLLGSPFNLYNLIENGGSSSTSLPAWSGTLDTWTTAMQQAAGGQIIPTLNLDKYYKTGTPALFFDLSMQMLNLTAISNGDRYLELSSWQALNRHFDAATVHSILQQLLTQGWKLLIVDDGDVFFSDQGLATYAKTGENVDPTIGSIIVNTALVDLILQQEPYLNGTIARIKTQIPLSGTSQIAAFVSMTPQQQAAALANVAALQASARFIQIYPFVVNEGPNYGGSVWDAPRVKQPDGTTFDNLISSLMARYNSIGSTVPDFTISATSPGAVISGQPESSTITIAPLNGFTGTLSLSDNAPLGLTCGAISPATLSASGTAALSCSSNSQGVYAVAITATSGSLSHQTTAAFTFGTPPDFTITATPPSAVGIDSSAKSTIAITLIHGLTGTVTLTDNVPSGLNCGSISSTSFTANDTAIVSCSSSSASTYTLTVTGTSGSLTHTATATFSFHDFSLSENPSSLSINPGGQGTSTISLNLLNGFGSTVALSVSSPTGVTVSLSTATISGSGTSTLTISPTTVGSYAVVVMGASGSLTRTISLTITVGSQDSPVLTAPTVETVVQTTAITFTVTGTDSSVPTRNLTLSANQLPSDASFTTVQGTSPVSGTFTWNPTTADTPGTYSVSFTVTDGVSSAQAYVVITVLGSNVLPIIVVPGPQNAPVGENLNFTVSAKDPSGTGRTVMLSATGLASNMAFDSSTGAFSFTPSRSQAGQTFMINFTATDSSDPSWARTQSVPIHVQSSSTSQPSAGGFCLNCLLPRGMTMNAWLLTMGALIGILSSIALLHIRATAELAAAKRRI